MRRSVVKALFFSKNMGAAKREETERRRKEEKEKEKKKLFLDLSQDDLKHFEAAMPAEEEKQKQKAEEQPKQDQQQEQQQDKEIRKQRAFTVFVDGASKGNHQRDKSKRIGGYGFFFEEPPFSFFERMDGDVTNNRCELMACIRLLEEIKGERTPASVGDKVEIVTGTFFCFFFELRSSCFFFSFFFLSLCSFVLF